MQVILPSQGNKKWSRNKLEELSEQAWLEIDLRKIGNKV